MSEIVRGRVGGQRESKKQVQVVEKKTKKKTLELNRKIAKTM